MTNEEAIQILNGIEEVRGDLPEDGLKIDEALIRAKEALEMQIPKRPVMDYQFPEKLREVIERTNIELAKSKTECCPVCGRPLGISQFVKTQTGQKYGDPHCKRCGQTIDWE